MRRATTILSALAVLVAALPAAAWTPRTRMEMAEEAVRLLPASLRITLEANRESLLRGMLEPMTEEDDPAHHSPAAGGTVDATVEAEAEALMAALARPRTPFDQLALGFGRLAHFVADAGFPPGVGESGHYEHFADFCESRREKFPLVFYGHLEVQDFADYTRQMMARAGTDDIELARAYAAAGNPPAPEAFDDRSVPFALASLSYSRTVTDIVRVWLSAWESAGGDMGRIPYMDED